MVSRTPKKEITGAQAQPEKISHLIDLGDLLDQLSVQFLGADEDEALDRAKQVYYEALDAPAARKRIALAKKAISISALCADAFVLLAEHEERASDNRLGLYRRAVDAGQRALGDLFEKFSGEFWGMIETRPFMRAKLGLANCLWERNEREEALCHLREMLQLNPNDNQGVRLILAAYLLEESLHAELTALFKTYKEDTSADFGYSRSLLAFRLHGDTAKSRNALDAAIKQNNYVIRYLTGQKKMPKSLPPYYSYGDISEAVHYAASFKKGWDMTSGAIEWLQAFSGSGNKTAPSRKKRSVQMNGAS